MPILGLRQKYLKSKSSGWVPIISDLITPWSYGQKRALWGLGVDKEYVPSIQIRSFGPRALTLNLVLSPNARITRTCMARAMKRDAKTVAGWDFTRIIPCHGVCNSPIAPLFMSISLICPISFHPPGRH